MTDVIPGVYRHYKGNFYEVLVVAIHSETREPLVVYRALYGDYAVYVRPVAMFVEEVDKPEYGYQGARFRLMKAF